MRMRMRMEDVGGGWRVEDEDDYEDENGMMRIMMRIMMEDEDYDEDGE